MFLGEVPKRLHHCPPVFPRMSYKINILVEIKFVIKFWQIISLSATETYKSLNIQHGQNWQVFTKRDFPSDPNHCVSLVVIIIFFLDYYIQWDNIRTFCCCGWWFSLLTHSRSLTQPSALLGSLISKTFVWVDMSIYNNMLLAGSQSTYFHHFSAFSASEASS